jgi:hypothetical protein
MSKSRVFQYSQKYVDFQCFLNQIVLRIPKKIKRHWMTYLIKESQSKSLGKPSEESFSKVEN